MQPESLTPLKAGAGRPSGLPRSALLVIGLLSVGRCWLGWGTRWMR